MADNLPEGHDSPWVSLLVLMVHLHDGDDPLVLSELGETPLECAVHAMTALETMTDTWTAETAADIKAAMRIQVTHNEDTGNPQ